MCRAQSLERSGSLGICPRCIIPENEDLCGSEEFPAVGSLLPFEVIPICQGGRASETREFGNEDVSASGCSSAAYSFAPINPAIRDVLTDLEVHEITRLERTNIESRRAWSKNSTLLSTSRRQLRTTECLVTTRPEKNDSKEGQAAMKLDAEDMGQEPGKEASRSIFSIASSALEVKPAYKSSEESESSHTGSDLSLCDGCPALEPAATDAVLHCPAPQSTFWDIDSRGSTGLNFVFVDDFPSKLPHRCPAECIKSCTSTTVDSVMLSSVDGKRFDASSMTSQECSSSNENVSKRELQPKYLMEIDIDGSQPFYGVDNNSKGDSSPTDGEHGYSEPYDVSFDFVTNTVSADGEGQIFHMAHSPTREMTSAFAASASSNVLRGFLRSQGRVVNSVLAEDKVAGDSVKITKSFIDIPSLDNVSRSYSDSDISEGRGRTRPGVAIYRNKLYEQREGVVKIEMPVRVNAELFLQQQNDSDCERSPRSSGKELIPQTPVATRFHNLQHRQTASERSEATLSLDGSVSRGSSRTTDSMVFSLSKPPRKAPGLEKCYSEQQASSPEIEAVEDDNKYCTKRTMGQMRSRSQLYDSSRSWMSQVTGNTTREPVSHLTHRSYAGDALIGEKQSRKYQKPPIRSAVYKGLSKLFLCFSG